MGKAEPQAPPKPAMSRWISPTKRRRKTRQDFARKIAHATAEAARRAMQEVQDQGRAGPVSGKSPQISGRDTPANYVTR